MEGGLLIVVSGPSGVGKGTVCRALLRKNPELKVSVSMTTRVPRRGEVEGRSYFFSDRNTFLKLIEEDAFLEWAEIYGDYYGTPRRFLAQEVMQGKDIILEIDTQGARQVRKALDGGVFIFLVPPSLAELKLRITKRGTESPQAISKRLAFVMEEMNSLDIYDYVVLNDSVDQAAKRINAIITAEKCSIARNKNLIENIIKGGRR